MLITVDHLSKSFDYYKKELGLKNSFKNLFHREKLTKQAVQSISFEIAEGEIVGFLGPNGAGKTTTLKMLSGILHPTGGQATVLGYTPWERKKAFKMQFAIVMGQKNQKYYNQQKKATLVLTSHYMQDVEDLCRRAIIINQGVLVYDGDLDLLITKPISLQFMATLRQADLTIFSVDVIAGGIMVAIAWSRLAIPADLYHVGGFLGFLVISSLVSYSLFLLPQVLSFWLLNTSAIAEITDSFWDFNNMPMDIYNQWIKQIGVFILPIFVITNFPPMFVLGKLPPAYLAWSALVPFLLLGLVRLAWTCGLRGYASASS